MVSLSQGVQAAKEFLDQQLTSIPSCGRYLVSVIDSNVKLAEQLAHEGDASDAVEAYFCRRNNGPSAQNTSTDAYNSTRRSDVNIDAQQGAVRRDSFQHVRGLVGPASSKTTDRVARVAMAAEQLRLEDEYAMQRSYVSSLEAQSVLLTLQARVLEMESELEGASSALNANMEQWQAETALLQAALDKARSERYDT